MKGSKYNIYIDPDMKKSHDKCIKHLPSIDPYSIPGIELLPYAGFDKSVVDKDIMDSDVASSMQFKNLLQESEEVILRKMKIKIVPDYTDPIRIIQKTPNTMTVTGIFKYKNPEKYGEFAVDSDKVIENAMKYIEKIPSIQAIATNKNRIVRKGLDKTLFRPFSSGLQIFYKDKSGGTRSTSCYSGNVMCVGAASCKDSFYYINKTNYIIANAMGISPKALSVTYRYDLLNYNFELNHPIDPRGISDVFRNNLGIPVIPGVKNDVPKIYLIYRLECPASVPGSELEHRFKGHLKFHCKCRFITMIIYGNSQKICISGCKSFMQVKYAITFLENIVFKRYHNKIVSKKYTI